MHRRVVAIAALAYAVRIDGTVMSTLYASELFPQIEERGCPTSVHRS